MESIETEVCTDTGKRDGKGRRLSGKEERERLLDLYDGSGLTQSEFCRREGINYHTFVAWLGRRKKAEPSAAGGGPRFHELRMTADPTSESMEVILPDGTLVRGRDAGALGQLVRILRGN